MAQYAKSVGECHLSALSVMCQVLWYMMSALAFLFCLQGRSVVVCGVSLCDHHCLLVLQVSIVSGIQLIVFSSVPLAFKVLSRGALGACHHLKFSLHNSFRLCSSVLNFGTCKLLLKLDLVQLDGES